MNAVANEILHSPLGSDQAATLARFADGLGAAELYWVAAWAARRAARLPEPGTAAAGRRLTILYGSQTGNARRCAERLAADAEARGLASRLLRADAYPQRDLAGETSLLVVISTQGEGEPPDDARGLFEFISGRRVPRLAGLHFAVLGLGDSGYPDFCTIGRRLDARLAELGGTRFAPFGACDVDIDEVALPWSRQALQAAGELPGLEVPAVPARAVPLHAVPARSVHGRENPFAATLLANQRIVARDCTRVVRHIELSLAGSGLTHAPGDALGVWPRNPPALVAQWLQALQLDGDQPVEHGGRELPLGEWLAGERELTRLTRGFADALARVAGGDELAQVLHKDNAAGFAELQATHQPIDLLRRHPAEWHAADLVAALRPLTPRLYSIASSPLAVGGDEVHLTVAEIGYQAFGLPHWGAASAFLGAAQEDATVPVFVEPNERFRLPADDARDVIMIGAGTGVAPFRAFVQHRREAAARGRNWLVFGNRHAAGDFLYQLEWQQALKSAALHRLDLAFSRDAADKVYVQDRLREQGRELFAWLQGGAHLYVCGDARRMARDVHAALVEVAVEHGGHDAESAAEWLAGLLAQGRYARDVY